MTNKISLEELGIELDGEEEVTDETLEELSNGKGDDGDE